MNRLERLILRRLAAGPCSGAELHSYVVQRWCVAGGWIEPNARKVGEAANELAWLGLVGWLAPVPGPLDGLVLALAPPDFEHTHYVALFGRGLVAPEQLSALAFAAAARTSSLPQPPAPQAPCPQPPPPSSSS